MYILRLLPPGRITLALLWSAQHADITYQVRCAGKTIRLYTNGVFHSQFNPQRPVDGSLWDMLSLPALMLPDSAGLKVLVLGVGGGTVLRQLNVLLDAPVITGIDIDPVHLTVACDWFGVTKEHATLIEADAITWLQQYRGPGFDLIIDDLFGESEGEPSRAIELDTDWSGALLNSLTDGGAVIVNTLECKSLRSHGFMSEKVVQSRYRCQLAEYENCVGVFLTGDTDNRFWRRRVHEHVVLTSAQKRLALALKLRRL